MKLGNFGGTDGGLPADRRWTQDVGQCRYTLLLKHFPGAGRGHRTDVGARSGRILLTIDQKTSGGLLVG